MKTRPFKSIGSWIPSEGPPRLYDDGDDWHAPINEDPGLYLMQDRLDGQWYVVRIVNYDAVYSLAYTIFHHGTLAMCFRWLATVYSMLAIREEVNAGLHNG